MRFLDVKSLFLGSKYFSWLIDTEKYRLHYDTYDFSSVQTVPWLSGACLMTKRQVFQEAGCFDENYFLYLEDMDLCMQIKKLGYSNIYLPSAEIVHFFGGSSETQKNQVNRIYKESATHYFRKNFNAIEYLVAKLYFSIKYC
jgi:GT2 family glycosyltransferase